MRPMTGPAPPTPPSRPENAVVILLDSLNRHMLGSHGGTEFATPNLDAFAKGALRFEKHYTGSLPCMPARHDILCGALDFLWRPWGSIELWERNIVAYLEKNNLWEDTAVIVCTDHGHYLGEKDIFGKPGVPIYEPLGHIPLMVRWPGVEAGTTNALTTRVDIFATLCDFFGVTPVHVTHGKSLVPLINGQAKQIREWALSGIWGREVNLVDADSKYTRAPAEENFPLSMWSNRWSTMPTRGANGKILMPPPDDRAYLDRLPGSRIPVIRQPFEPGDLLPYWATGSSPATTSIDLNKTPRKKKTWPARNAKPTSRTSSARRCKRCKRQTISSRGWGWSEPPRHQALGKHRDTEVFLKATRGD